MFNDLVLLYPSTAYTLLGICSLLIGSLLNVIIYRLPLMLHAEWKTQCQALLQQPVHIEKHVNLFFPRSFCPKCKSLIHAWQNIPLLSYLYLRGRCGQCRHPISWQYPVVELTCMGLSLLAGYHFGFNISLFFALLFIWLMICMCFIDLHHQLLPDSLSLSLLWLGLIANTQSLFTPLPTAVFAAVGAYISLWLFIKLFFLLTGKIGMGHGDFKLFAAFGAWFGWAQLPLILIISSMSGAVIGVIILKIKGKSHKTPIAFGPFLCIAGLISLFCGNSIIAWYWSTFVTALH